MRPKDRGERGPSHSAETSAHAWSQMLAPTSPLVTLGDLDLAEGWALARGALDGILGQLREDIKESWALRIANYGNALHGQLSLARTRAAKPSSQPTKPVS